MQKLVSLGYAVYAICPSGEYSGKFSEFGIVHIPYNIERGSLNPLKELKAIISIKNAIKSLDLDILHAFTIKPNIYGAIVGKLLGIKNIVCSVTGLGSFYIDESLKARLFRRLIEVLYRMAFYFSKAVIFQNSTDMEFFVKKGVLAPQKAHLVRSSGVDTDYFSPLNTHHSSLTVLMIARAIWHKGVREYYEAASIAKKEMPSLRFLYIGGTDDGNPACADEQFLRSSPDVEYLGERKDIKEQIAGADIVVLLSYREGVPRTLLEASAMAKPLVATDTVGCTEVVRDGENGFLVPVKNGTIPAQKIIELAKNPELRERFGKRAREIAVGEFDVKIVVEKYLQIYEKLLKDS